ncbi:metallochaperone AztD [Acuticoccus mangrovi]|uniref:Metallochaperone AztD n=1 Tax=Acuticoccus mangrovi TaxID=2796142 RepID=A0A934ITS2_9HYPH|nr:metallochaperone AztD [Acuticoccus mangrovi]MBJ3778042.1 metallochaperone AztD [Acuticoccus mangrovi]
MRPSLRRLTCLTAAALIGTTAAAVADEEMTVWRLFVADQAEPLVTVLDLDSDREWHFPTKGPARLYAGPSGRAIVAVQSDDDTVAFLDSGIVREGHGDHVDIEVSDPTLVEDTITGPRPFHLITHDDVVAINFDKGGYASFLDEHDIVAGNVEETTFAQNRAHHGFAVLLKNAVVSSVASSQPGGEAPWPRVGIQAFGENGAPIGEMQPCTDLHGEAFSGRYLVTGCKEGVVAVDVRADPPSFAMMPYPDGFPEGHTGTLLGAKAMQMFLGNYGSKAVVVIDPTTAPYFTLIELPFRRVDFILDPAHPQYAYVFTEDGSLHRINMLRAEIAASATITAPYSMDGHWRDPRPRLAVAGDVIAVTDPAESLVRLVDATTLEEVATRPVDGLPYNIVAVGGDGLTH